jgi:hypothetical protein
MSIKLGIPDSIPAAERRMQMHRAGFRLALVRMERQLASKSGDMDRLRTLRRIERKQKQLVEAWKEVQL